MLQEKEKSVFATPILFIVFNRPDTTRRVFEVIRKVKPSRLYIAADGPRETVASDKYRCEEVRSIKDSVDWDCEVKVLFQEKNLGCKKGPITAIDWFFKNEEEGIILEDDCLPNASFFTFCSDLLKRYRDNNTIMHISGNNFQQGNKRGEASYYFSKYSHSWGWATWRRAWNMFHPSLEKFDTFDASQIIKEVPVGADAQKFWIKNFRQTMQGNDSWDSLWMYTIWHNDGVCILPNVNLVFNIGFSNEATHTKGKDTIQDEVQEISVMVYSKEVILNKEADMFTFKRLFKKSFFSKVMLRLETFVANT